MGLGRFLPQGRALRSDLCPTSWPGQANTCPLKTQGESQPLAAPVPAVPCWKLTSDCSTYYRIEGGSAVTPHCARAPVPLWAPSHSLSCRPHSPVPHGATEFLAGTQFYNYPRSAMFKVRGKKHTMEERTTRSPEVSYILS